MHILTIIGKVGTVQQLKQVGDTHVLNFTLASNEYKSKEKRTTWFQCALWGQHAENIAQYVVVGKGLAVTGHLLSDESGNPETYVSSRDGSTRASFNVNVSDVEFTSSARDTEYEPAQVEEEDDIPF